MENLYPEIITEENLLKYTEKYNEVNSKLDETRKSEILNKQKELKRLYEKNIKLKKRWSNSEIGIMISSLILTGAISGIIGIFFPLTIALGIGASSSLIEILSYGTIHQLISKKQKYYENKSIIIKSYIDRLQLLFEDIISDNIISDKEYDIYLKLIKDFELEINSNNNEMSKFIEYYKNQWEIRLIKKQKRN